MKTYEISQRIFELRTLFGLSQHQLALLAGTSQAVISKYEDENYDGHSVRMLQRIADALQCNLSITLAPRNGFVNIEEKHKRKTKDRN